MYRWGSDWAILKPQNWQLENRLKYYLLNINISLYGIDIVAAYVIRMSSRGFEEIPPATHPAGKNPIMFSITYLWTSD